MIVRILLWLSGFLHVLEFERDGNERYFLGAAFGRGLYLHRFRAGDLGPHNHPWDFSVSLLLSGFYIERRMEHIGARERVRVVKAGTFNVIRGATFHCLDIPNGTEVWTLFFHGKQCNTWGWLKRSLTGWIWTVSEKQGGEDGNGTIWKDQPRASELRIRRKHRRLFDEALWRQAEVTYGMDPLSLSSQHPPCAHFAAGHEADLHRHD